MGRDRARPVVGVGVVLRRDDGRIALGHRVTAGESPSWCLPGGHLEAGEPLVGAGLRELAEEAGVEVGDGELAGVCVDLTGSGVTFAVTATAPPGTVLRVTEPHAVDEWRWVDPDGPDELPGPLFGATAAVLHVVRAPDAPLAGWDLTSLRRTEP